MFPVQLRVEVQLPWLSIVKQSDVASSIATDLLMKFQIHIILLYWLRWWRDLSQSRTVFLVKSNAFHYQWKLNDDKPTFTQTYKGEKREQNRHHLTMKVIWSEPSFLLILPCNDILFIEEKFSQRSSIIFLQNGNIKNSLRMETFVDDFPVCIWSTN